MGRLRRSLLFVPGSTPDRLDSPYGADDLAAVVPAVPDALLFPKVESPGEVLRLEAEVARLEAAAGLEPGRIRFHLLIETVSGVLQAPAIAGASARVAAL